MIQRIEARCKKCNITISEDVIRKYRIYLYIQCPECKKYIKDICVIQTSCGCGQDYND